MLQHFKMICRFFLENVQFFLVVFFATFSSKEFWVYSQGVGEIFKRVKEYRPISVRTMETYEACKMVKTVPKSAEALLILEGNKLSLTCPLCLKPTDHSLGVWKKVLPEKATFVPVHFDGVRSRLLSDTTIEIDSVLKDDTGIYICVHNMEVVAKYAVDVVQREPHRYVVMGGKKKKSAAPSDDVALKGLNLILGVSWSEWSQCNRCSAVGRRRRVGICTIRKQNMMLPSKPVDTQILNEYKKGIPCRSHLLPEPIRNLPAVIDQKSEFVVGFCKIPCASFGGIISVTDQTGAVIDTVDNSKGVYSMHQPLPPLPAIVSRRTLHEEVGKSIMMTCPGNNQGRFLIWRNDSFVINPSKVHVLTKGRVKIDFANNLHIRKLRFSDTSIYSCWNDKTLVGTIRLQVIEKTSETRFGAYVLNLGIFFTFIIISTVTFTVCRNVRLDKE